MNNTKLITITCCVSMMVYNNYVVASEPNSNEINKKANDNKLKGLDVTDMPLHCNIENNVAIVMPGFCCWSPDETYVYDNGERVDVVNIDNKWYVAGTENSKENERVQVVAEKSPYTGKIYIHYKKDGGLYSDKWCTDKCIFVSNGWEYDKCKNDIKRTFNVCNHCGRCELAIVKGDVDDNEEVKRDYRVNNLYKEIGLDNYVFMQQEWLVKNDKISKRCDLNGFCNILLTNKNFSAYCNKIREYYNLNNENKVIGEEE